MHDFSSRKGFLYTRPAFFLLILTLCLSGPFRIQGSVAAPEEEVSAAVETFLRGYTEEAMLYQERDQRSGTVAGAALSPEARERTFHLDGKDKTLAQLIEDIAFLEKKADYYAGMRQIQNIYREDLQLDYTYQEMEFEEDVCHVKVTEAASFRYLDSPRPSVNEAVYWIDLVKLDGQWLVASATDGSGFDKSYSKQGAAFDPAAALETLAAELQREDCRVTYPAVSGGWGTIPYDGAGAAAYAYTYSRLTAQAQKPEYYNPLFVNYAGRGGDCMNFASQCIWAGFGGSETASAISGHSLPMDASGEGQWYGCTPGQSKINGSWISCQSFRKYLTGQADASGSGGTNGSEEPGLYATILHVPARSSLSGVEPWELIGAAAHIEGGSGPYGHAIVITDAEGLRRDQIYFCGHTKNVTHIKLGDVFLDEMKVYIPRYFRTGVSQDNCLRPIRLAPVPAGERGFVGAYAAAPQPELRVTVTAPGGEPEQIAYEENASFCGGEWLFPVPGLYRVDCRANTGGGEKTAVFYVRCYTPQERPEDGGFRIEESGGAEQEEIPMPGWLLPEEEAPASGGEE